MQARKLYAERPVLQVGTTPTQPEGWYYYFPTYFAGVELVVPAETVEKARASGRLSALVISGRDPQIGAALYIWGCKNRASMLNWPPLTLSWLDHFRPQYHGRAPGQDGPQHLNADVKTNDAARKDEIKNQTSTKLPVENPFNHTLTTNARDDERGEPRALVDRANPDAPSHGSCRSQIGSSGEEKTEPSDDEEVPPDAEKQDAELVQLLPPRQHTCLLCNQATERYRTNADPEVMVHLPCGHSFGHLCLMKRIRGMDDSQVVCPVRNCIQLRHICGHILIPTQAPSKNLFRTPGQPIDSRCEFCATQKGGDLSTTRDQAVRTAGEEYTLRQDQGLGWGQKLKHTAKWALNCCKNDWYTASIDREYERKMRSRERYFDDEAFRLAKKNAAAQRAQEESDEMQRRREATADLLRLKVAEKHEIREADDELDGELRHTKVLAKQSVWNAHQHQRQAIRTWDQKRREARAPGEQRIKEELQRRKVASAEQKARDAIARDGEPN